MDRYFPNYLKICEIFWTRESVFCMMLLIFFHLTLPSACSVQKCGAEAGGGRQRPAVFWLGGAPGSRAHSDQPAPGTQHTPQGR